MERTMKLLISLIIIIGLIIIYLAFAKDVKFLEILIYIMYGFSLIGMFSPTTYNNIERKYKWYNHLIGFPCTLGSWYIGLNYGGEIYVCMSILFNLVIYTVLFSRKTFN
jgi:hypothetical protein